MNKEKKYKPVCQGIVLWASVLSKNVAIDKWASRAHSPPSLLPCPLPNFYFREKYVFVGLDVMHEACKFIVMQGGLRFAKWGNLCLFDALDLANANLLSLFASLSLEKKIDGNTHDFPLTPYGLV